MPLVPEHINNLRPYDPGKPMEDVMREYNLKYVVKLASNENPLGVSPHAIQAMIASLYQINRYPDISSKILCEKLAEVYNLDVGNIITGHGSEAIMSVIVRTYLCAGDEVLTSEGTFVGFYVIANAWGIKPITVPLKDYRFDLDAIADAITNKTKIIYLVNPNNPTGNIFTKIEFDKFIERVPSSVMIILDEAYHEFVQGRPDYPDSMDYRLNNIITLRTFSKAYGLAGIRLGYGFGHNGVIKNLMKVRLPFEPGIPSQMAGVTALNDHQFLEYYLELNQIGLKYLYSVFERFGIRYIKSEANFVMCVMDSAETVNNIIFRLLTKGVIIRGLKAFGLPHCLRVSVGLQKENEFFAEKLEEVLNEINFDRRVV